MGLKASETGWPTRACSRAASTAVLPFSMVNNSVFSLNHLTILIDPCTGYLGYPCEKSVIDDAIRSFPAPSLHQAGGDSVAHVAVYCSVLEWISLSSQYRGLGCLLSFLPSKRWRPGVYHATHPCQGRRLSSRGFACMI